MTDQEIALLLNEIETKANDAIDKLIVRRQSCDKALPRYLIKKLEIIVGACHRAQDKLPVDFHL